MNYLLLFAIILAGVIAVVLIWAIYLYISYDGDNFHIMDLRDRPMATGEPKQYSDNHKKEGFNYE